MKRKLPEIPMIIKELLDEEKDIYFKVKDLLDIKSTLDAICDDESQVTWAFWTIFLVLVKIKKESLKP